MKEQTQYNIMVKTFYDSHILCKEAAATSSGTSTITPTPMATAKETTADAPDTGVINPVSQATDSSDSEEQEHQHNQQQKSRSIYKNNS
jgi:hypothetical protein